MMNALPPFGRIVVLLAAIALQDMAAATPNTLDQPDGARADAGAVTGQALHGGAASAAQQAGSHAVRLSDIEPALARLVAVAAESGLTAGLQLTVVTASGERWSTAFGTADLDTQRPVEEDTRFYIASTTKALTALAAARLHARGELDLDATLAEAFPAATRFPDGFDASEVTVRDLLTHTHGLDCYPISFRVAFTGQYTNRKLLDLLAGCERHEDRSFRYTNLGYDLAGVLMSPDQTRGWKDVVHREVLAPLGMKHTTARRSELEEAEIAMPHDLSADGLQRIRLAKDDPNLGPAGGHFATTGDLARLIEAQLTGGRVGGRQVIASEVIAGTQQEQVPQQRTFFHYERFAWGLGWDIGHYRGERIVHRPGGFAGYYANAAFLPEHGVGLAVLTNGGMLGARLAELVAAAVYDTLLGHQGARARLEAEFERLGPLLERRRAQLAEARDERAAPGRLPRPAAEYLGRYENETWGSVEITAEPEDAVGRPRADAAVLKARMGVALTALRPPGGAGDEIWQADLLDEDDELTFDYGGDGRATAFTVRGAGARFVRLPEATRGAGRR